MTRRIIKLSATKVEAEHKHIPHWAYFQHRHALPAHSHTVSAAPDTDGYKIPADGAPPGVDVSVTLHDVDVTDFLDAEMAVEELDHRDLLNAMDVGDVADWLRGEGYQVEED